jgi:hypothetical protein
VADVTEERDLLRPVRHHVADVTEERDLLRPVRHHVADAVARVASGYDTVCGSGA